MRGFEKIALAIALSLNLNEDADILSEKIIFGETHIEQGIESAQYEGCALILEEGTPMYDKISLEEEICTLDKGTLVFAEDKGNVLYVHNNELGGFIKKETATTKNIFQEAENLGLTKVIKPECSVDIYSKPYYEGENLLEVTARDTLELIGELDDFYKVVKEGQEGYIEKRYARETFEFKPIVMEEDTKEEYNNELHSIQLTKQQALEIIRNSSDNEDSLGTKVALKAIDYIGNKYEWGGNSLDDGIDCSGFAKQLYAKFGVSLPRVSRYQAQSNVAIAEEELKPGDLVFYDKNGTVNHVAIYLGAGYIIHASNRADYPVGGVKISRMNYREPCKYVRVGGT